MFKNIKNVIHSSAFTQPNRYIMHHNNQVLNPAAQFFNPNKSKNDYTPFESSMLALALSNQTQAFQKMMAEAEGSQFSKFKLEAQEQLKMSSELSSFFIQNCYQVFRQENFDVPIKGYTSFLMAAVNENKADIEYFKTYIFPRIQEKVNFLDKEGCEDALESFEKLNYTDKVLVPALLERYNQQNVQLESCTNSDWNLDTYALAPLPKTQDIYLQYFNDLKSNSGLANQKHQYRQIKQLVTNKLWNRFFFREARIESQFVKMERQNSGQLIEQAKSKLLA